MVKILKIINAVFCGLLAILQWDLIDCEAVKKYIITEDRG